MLIGDIESLELELTSRCNAACPQCPRQMNKYVAGLDHKRELTLENLKSWIPKETLNSLKEVIFKGTFSEPLMSKNIEEIISWISSETSASIKIHTNGSLRDNNFWTWLGKNLPKNSNVIFALDGLEDTHHLYRVNTNFTKIIENAKTFINNGGTASWQFIVFKHNEHQLDSAKKIAISMGFSEFLTIYSDRFTDEVQEYTIKKEKIKLEKSENSLTSKEMDKAAIESIVERKVICQSLKNKEIFINWDGEVFPCCQFGIFSIKNQKTFDYQYWHKKVLSGDSFSNNLHYNTLFEILEKFNNFYNNVEKNTKISICGKFCGTNRLSSEIAQRDYIGNQK